MAGVNSCTFVGNLGRDPEIRYAQSGTAIAKINLAVSERVKSGDEWTDHTEWVRITCFGRTAENVGQYLAKGRQIYVEGRMRTSKYTDRDGQEKWSTEIVANKIVFLSSGGGGGEGGDFGGGSGGQQGGNGNRGSRGGGGGNRGGSGGSQRGSGGGNRGGGGGGGGDDGCYDDDLPF